MDSNATDGFRKLSHLLQSPPFPPQAVKNLLMLLCQPQQGVDDRAAAVMADNPELVASSLSRVMPTTLWLRFYSCLCLACCQQSVHGPLHLAAAVITDNTELFASILSKVLPLTLWP